MESLLYVGLALFGLLFGSFANVVIWRFPRDESLSYPGSHCPVCEAPIAWYDNVPVLSWIALGGRCRACDTVISVRYPVVELLSAVLWVLAGILFGVSLQTAWAILFFYLLLVLSFIDLDVRRLPNELVGLLFGFGVVGVALSQFKWVGALPLLPGGAGLLGEPAVFAGAGAVSAAGFMFIIALLYERIRDVQGLGMGDVKLLVVMGLYLGLYALLALFFASVLGAVYAVLAARSEDISLRTALPFGPFLAVGAIIVTALGPAAWSWYTTLLT